MTQGQANASTGSQLSETINANQVDNVSPIRGGGCLIVGTCNGISGQAFHQTESRLRLEITNKGEEPVSVEVQMGFYLSVDEYHNVDAFIHNKGPFRDIIPDHPIAPGTTYGIDFHRYPSFGGYFLIYTGNGYYQVPGFVPYGSNQIP